MKVLLGTTSNTYLNFVSLEAVKEIHVCEDANCTKGYKINEAGYLIFVASNDKAGNYTLIDFVTKKSLKAFQVQLEKPLSK